MKTVQYLKGNVLITDKYYGFSKEAVTTDDGFTFPGLDEFNYQYSNEGKAE